MIEALRLQDEWPARWASPTIMGYRCPSPKGPGWMNLWPVGPQVQPNEKGNVRFVGASANKISA